MTERERDGETERERDDEVNIELKNTKIEI